MRCKRPAQRRRLPLKWKLFISLSAFTAVLLCFLWVFQLVLLDDFYYFITKNSLIRTGESLVNADVESLQETADHIAISNDICILVFDGDGNMLASAETNASGIIHKLGNNSLNKLYSDAVNDGGYHLSSVTLDRSHTDNTAREEPLIPDIDSELPLPDDGIPGLPEPENHGVQEETNKRVTGFSRLVFSRVAKSADGGVRFVLLDCPLTPVDSIVSTLRVQLIVISCAAAIIALIIAVIFSRHMSNPIVGLSRSAALLADGKYDAVFNGGGCREIDELSKTLTYASGELSKVDRMQKELIANISHDLRTPLTMIAGYGEVMRDIPGENTPENVQVIIDETQRLKALVDDLLQITRLQNGVRTRQTEVFSLTEALRETVARFGKLNECKGYTIVCEAEEDVRVRADRSAILQVIYNLIGNAISYTGGDMTVRVTQSTGDGYVRVDISDSGEGIPEEELPYIWNRYYKANSVHRRGVGGSGIGLSIVKGVLDEHKAVYGVSSDVGKGSDFWFRLPVAEE